jgi:hypothetical protein
MPARPPPPPSPLRALPQVQALISYLEHEPQPMIVLDPDYRILAANTAYRGSSAPSTGPTSATSATASRTTTTCPATRPASTAR